MRILLTRRAEIALRSLSPIDKKQIVHSLQNLQLQSLRNLICYGKVRKLTGSATGLYSYRATERLRLLLLIHTNECIVEYIVDHDHFERLFSRGGGV